MNLEELISKYLDGELTDKEDEILRSEIASNDLARDKFDASVNLHMNFREDAKNIETPADLFEDTQELILARISSDMPFSVPIITNIDDSVISGEGVKAEPETEASRNLINKWKKNNQTERAANQSDIRSKSLAKLLRKGSLVLAAMLILMVSQIDHKLIKLNSTNSSKVIAENVSTTSVNDNIESNTRLENLTSSRRNRSEAAIGELFESNSQLLVSSEANSDVNSANMGADFNSISEGNDVPVSIPSNKDDGIATNIMPDGASESTDDKPILEKLAHSKSIVNSVVVKNYPENNSDTHQSIIPMQTKSNTSNYNMAFDKMIAVNEIQISSFLGTEIYRGGIESVEDQVVSNFSQSIAYSVSNHDRMGVEVGYTEYTYNENVILNLPIGSVPTQTMVEVSGGGGNDDLIAYPVKVNKHKPMYWGAAFYEKTLFDQYGISLNGRLGFGGSGDGPMTYSRLFGKYEVFPFMSITFGADGRFFTSLMQSKNGDTKDIKSSVSLIYGLQVKF